MLRDIAGILLNSKEKKSDTHPAVDNTQSQSVSRMPLQNPELQ